MKDKNLNYQMVAVLTAKTEEKEREKIFSKLAEMLSPQGGEVAKKENLGVKEMVYPIAKQTKGDYWELTLNSKKPLNFKEINLFLNRNNSVLRYLVIKQPAVAGK